MSEKQKYLIHLRASSLKQQKSGLGILSQKKVCEDYVKSIDGEIFEIVTEIESGFNKDRISISNNLSLEKLLRKREKLLYTIKQAQKNNCIIVFKELSRCTRFCLLFDWILSAGIKVVFVDHTGDNEFMLRLRSGMAQAERLEISTRTRQSLLAKKLNNPNVKLGSPQNLTKEAIEKAHKRKKEIARNCEANRRATSLIVLCRNAGMIFQDITNKLNDDGYTTANGYKYRVGTVVRLFYRYINDNNLKNK